MRRYNFGWYVEWDWYNVCSNEQPGGHGETRSASCMGQ